MKAKNVKMTVAAMVLSAATFTGSFALAGAVSAVPQTAYAAEIDTQEDATPGEPAEDVIATAGNAAPPTVISSTGHYDRSYKTGERFPYLMWFAAAAALGGLSATALGVRYIKRRKEQEISDMLK